jgi:hypothetical protein
MEEKILVIDDRYLVIDGDQSRLAVSWGPNPANAPARDWRTDLPEGYRADSEHKRIIAPDGHVIGVLDHQPLEPPRVPGDTVFGIHNVITDGERVSIVDAWIDTREAAGITTESGAVERARQILCSILDEEYRSMCLFDGVVGEFAKLPIPQWTLEE